MSRRQRSLSRSHASHPPVAAPPAGAGEVEAEVAHRPDERVELEQRPILLERPLQVLGPVRRAEAAPGDEVGVRRDRRGGIDLQQRQPLDDLEQILRARRVEQLRAHRDPPRLLLRQPMHPREAIAENPHAACASHGCGETGHGRSSVQRRKGRNPCSRRSSGQPTAPSSPTVRSTSCGSWPSEDGSRIVAVHANELMRGRSSGYAALADEPELEEKIAKQVEELRSVGIDATLEIRGDTKSVATLIAEAAEEVDADLIVVATHGSGGLKTALMGSVARALCHTAKTPGARDPAGEEARAGSREGRPASQRSEQANGGRARSPPAVRPSTTPGPRARSPELPAPRSRPRSARAPRRSPAGPGP